jgi:hypothetical protein
MRGVVRAFFAMCRVHEMLVVLVEARKAPLSEDEECRLSRLLSELTPANGWSMQTLAALEHDAKIKAFLKSLRHHFE